MSADEVLRSAHEGRGVRAHLASGCVAPTGPNSQPGPRSILQVGRVRLGAGVGIAQGHTGPWHVPLQG